MEIIMYDNIKKTSSFYAGVKCISCDYTSYIITFSDGRKKDFNNMIFSFDIVGFINE